MFSDDDYIDDGYFQKFKDLETALTYDSYICNWCKYASIKPMCKWPEDKCIFQFDHKKFKEFKKEELQ